VAYEDLSESPIKGKRNSTDKSSNDNDKKRKKNDTSVNKVKVPINHDDDDDDGNETDEQEIPTKVIPTKGKSNDKDKSTKGVSATKSKDDTNTSIASKSKGKTNTTTTKDDDNNDKKANEKAKAYYPTVDYELSASVLKNIKDKSDKDKLTIIIKDIVSVEKKALEGSFKSQKEAGQQAMLKSMLEVLNMLPAEIDSSCPDNAQFLQEKVANQSEKKELNSLTKTLSSLQAQSSSLSKYENDISELFKSYDLWLEPPPSNTDDKSVSVFKEESDQFETLLLDMEKNCQRVLSEATDMTVLMSSARQVQEKLYNTYQRSRLIPTVGTSNPKDILKTLQKI